MTTALTTVVSLAVVSGAAAMRPARDPFNLGGGAEPTPVVASSSSGFNWDIVAIAAPMIVAAVIVAYAVARVARSRGSLATSH